MSLTRNGQITRAAGPTVALWLGVTAGLAFYALVLWRHGYFFHDDAYISLRYAVNLVAHGELTWNPGEPVEGYTNFLFVLLSAGLIKLGVPPVAAVQGLNLAALLALAPVAVLAVRRVAPERPEIGGLALFTLFATPSLAVWTLGGLETPVLAAMLGFGLTALLGKPGRWGIALAGLAFSLAVLTRMDAAVMIVGAGLGFWLGDPSRWRAALFVVGFPAAVSLVHMAWRLNVYGELLPLTFYAKTGLPIWLRLTYLPSYFVNSLNWMPVLGFGLVALVLASVKRLRPAGLHLADLSVPAGALLVHSAYVVWSGGDHMPAARVLLVAVFPATLVVLAFAVRLHGSGTRMMALAAALTLIANLAHFGRTEDRAAFVGGIVGRYIAQEWPEGSLVAVHTAGSTPFEAPGLRFIDMLGLNDPHIAHRSDIPLRAPMQVVPGHGKGDGAYVLSRRPDFIIAGFAAGNPVGGGVFLSDIELAELPEFARCYRQTETIIPYDEATARRGPTVPRPLVFTYYRRICEVEP